MEGHHSLKKVTAAGIFLSLGIVFGDIGTSPLYVLKAIIGHDEDGIGNVVDREVVLGAISCIFWTLTFQTTLKYVIFTLRADNKGEGGIFSLYTLVRRKAKWLFIPVIIGGATLLADGIITPAISVTSAVEGLQLVKKSDHSIDKPLAATAANTVQLGASAGSGGAATTTAPVDLVKEEPFITQNQVILIVSVILIILFVFQRFGTRVVGRTFGFVMVIWFGMLATLGVSQIMQSGHWDILTALNPTHAYRLLMEHKGGFWVLGAVFLCTTGAEALYSDMGHCGKNNIRVSWVFVKICLLLNYMGQGAWLLDQAAVKARLEVSPFFSIMPTWFLIPGVIIATMATIIASQALITGSYTLVNEAMRLNFWPKAKIVYPTILKEQPYIPGVNWLLLAGCLVIVFYFQKSEKMEAAYGLAITVTMLVTTLLLHFYLNVHQTDRAHRTTDIMKKIGGYLLVGIFLVIEVSFLIANLDKFPHGGWVTLLVSGVIMLVMYVWYRSRKIKNRYTDYIPMAEFIPKLRKLSTDESIPKYATHLVYLTNSNSSKEIEKKIEYSLFNKQPKRADVYWFVHVDVVDEPSACEYKVRVLDPGHVVYVRFRLGFRVEPKVNLYLRKVIEELVEEGNIDLISRYQSLRELKVPGDFKFVVIERILNYDYDLPVMDEFVMAIYSLLAKVSLTDERAFGLDTSLVVVEKVPLIRNRKEQALLKRMPD